mmetsp:Transcript_51799/g.148527  ORF Transcript_51799/g.148527 Transcript_51799/m.148527 type:complete len:272 (-) Transcript_51799:75-890(-)
MSLNKWHVAHHLSDQWCTARMQDTPPLYRTTGHADNPPSAPAPRTSPAGRHACGAQAALTPKAQTCRPGCAAVTQRRTNSAPAAPMAAARLLLAALLAPRIPACLRKCSSTAALRSPARRSPAPAPPFRLPKLLRRRSPPQELPSCKAVTTAARGKRPGNKARPAHQRMACSVTFSELPATCGGAAVRVASKPSSSPRQTSSCWKSVNTDLCAARSSSSPVAVAKQLLLQQPSVAARRSAGLAFASSTRIKLASKAPLSHASTSGSSNASL